MSARYWLVVTDRNGVATMRGFDCRDALRAERGNVAAMAGGAVRGIGHTTRRITQEKMRAALEADGRTVKVVGS